MSKTQMPLFEELPASAPGGLTVAEVVKQAKPQNRQQATFQRLIRQIEERRASIGHWQDYQSRYQQRIVKDVHPLQDKIEKKQMAMLQLLDRQFDAPAAIRGKKQREKLSEIIFDLCCELLQKIESGPEHAFLISLHDKYSELSFEEGQALERSMSIDMIEQMFGVRLDEDEVSVGERMDDLLLKAARKLSAGEPPSAGEKPPRKKTAKAIAAEEKRLAAEKEVSQSVREVYRKLASALHPDRHSQDLTAGQKTSLMQRVNRAYDEGNLLELLNIQLEIEQIDADHLSGLPDARIAHYNKVLREQLKELDNELFVLKSPYCQILSTTYDITPERVDREIDKDIREMKLVLKHLDADLQTYEDPRLLVQLLKNYSSAGEARMPEDIAFALDEIMAGGMPPGFGEPPVKPARKSRKK